MKRRICSILMALLLCLSLAVPVFAAEETLYLSDGGEILTDMEEAVLDEDLRSYSESYKVQFIIYTLRSAGSDIDRSIQEIYDDSGMGYGETHDGVFLLVSMQTREYRILSNGKANKAIGDREIDKICDVIEPALREGNYVLAFDSFVQECAYYLEGYDSGFPFAFGKNLLICLVLGLVVALIVTSVMRSKLKSVRRQTQANAYIRPGSLDITLRNDIFLYRNVTKVRKEPPKASGGNSGSSRSVGGGSF